MSDLTERAEESRRWWSHVFEDELRRAGDDKKLQAAARAKYFARVALLKDGE